MAKTPRQTHKIFGSIGLSSNFAKFGSLVAGTPIKTKDISVIQSLSAWDEGFQSSIFGGNKALLLEDLNSFAFEHSLQIGYLFQSGIPEFDLATEYSKGSFVQREDGGDATGEVFQSLIDANIGNAPPVAASNANWLFVNPPTYVKGAATINVLPKITNATPTTGVVGSKTLGDSEISEDDNNIILGLPLKFPDASEQTVAADPITIQSVVTGSRSFNTNFQNTTGKVMWVAAASQEAVPGAGASANAFTDSNPIPTTAVNRASGISNASVVFIVLPGNFYRVESAEDINIWTEWF